MVHVGLPIRKLSLSSRPILENSNIKYVFLIHNWVLKVFYHHTGGHQLLCIFIQNVLSGLQDGDDS